jgi:hypothetical protein
MTTLLLDGHYIFNKTPWLSWGELLFGLERGYISEKGVIDYICDALTIEAPIEAFEIASLEPYQQYLVSDLLKTLKEQECSADLDSTEPWLFLLLYFVLENKDEYQDPLQTVEELYSDFDYPEKIAPIVRYMPPPDGIEGSEELLFKNWKNILSNYEVFFESRNRAPIKK